MTPCLCDHTALQNPCEPGQFCVRQTAAGKTERYAILGVPAGLHILKAGTRQVRDHKTGLQHGIRPKPRIGQITVQKGAQAQIRPGKIRCTQPGLRNSQPVKIRVGKARISHFGADKCRPFKACAEQIGAHQVGPHEQGNTQIRPRQFRM